MLNLLTAKIQLCFCVSCSTLERVWLAGLQRLDLENDADTQDTPLDAIDDATTDVSSQVIYTPIL